MPECWVMLIAVPDSGGFSLQLCGLYPKLRLVVQDRGPVLKQAKEVVWPKENPTALAEGRVSFVQHDFFQSNPIQAAEVYWLRYILYAFILLHCFIFCGCFCAQWPHLVPLFIALSW